MSEPKCVTALKNYRQADLDGVMVNVSRQAIHETIDLLVKVSCQRDALLAACEAALGIAANCKRLEDATWAAKHQYYRGETPRMAQHRKAIEDANNQLTAAIAAAKANH